MLSFLISQHNLNEKLKTENKNFHSNSILWYLFKLKKLTHDRAQEVAAVILRKGRQKSVDTGEKLYGKKAKKIRLFSEVCFEPKPLKYMFEFAKTPLHFL